MKYCLLIVVVLLSFFSFAQKKKSAEDLYKDGLREEGAGKPKEAFQYFLQAARSAESGSELKLKSINKSTYYFTTANAQEKSELSSLKSSAVKILFQSKRTDTLAADIYIRSAQIYRQFYQPDSALLYFNIANKIVDELYGKESTKAAECYRGIGEVYEAFFYDYSKAEALYEQGLAIYEKLPSSEWSNFMIGIMYAHLVEVNRKQKDLDKTLFYSVRNIPLAESMIVKYPAYTENAYEGIALSYGDLGQLDKARQFYNKAIAQNRLTNHRTDNPLLGNYYESLGELDEKEKLSRNAIVNYEKAEQIFRSLNDSKSPKYIRTLQRLSALYASLNKAKSLRYLTSALGMLEHHGLTKSGQAAELNSSIGQYFEDENQIDSALFYYQRALQSCSNKFNSVYFKDNPSIEDIALKDYAFQVAVKKAQLLSEQFVITSKLSYAESALACYSLSEKLLSESRVDLDMDRSKWDFFDSNFSLYEQAISLLFKMNNKRSSDTLSNLAFRYMEGSKSKTLSDALNQAEFAEPLVGVDSLVQALNAEKRKLHLYEDQLKKLNANPGNEKASNKEKISYSMIAADRTIQQIEKQLNEKYPSYLKTKYQNTAHSLKEMQNYVTDRSASLVEYFWGIENVYAIAIDGKRIQHKRIGRVDSVERAIRTMLDFLKAEHNDYSQKSVTLFASSATDLYRMLLYPFRDQLENSNHLIIIPDGLLGQLPFEVVNVADTSPLKPNYQSLNYLVKTHFLSYSFSSAYLLNEKSKRTSNPQLVAFGFTGNETTRSRPSDGNFQEIVGSEEEIKNLAEKFPDGEFFLGKEVTEERFKEKAPSFDILHLAVHGRGDTEQNYSASLYFRDSLNNGKEDGILNWYELFDIRLKAQLTVISSCESGIGKAYRGEGMLSMANAFAYAGCRNVVMGLWKVNDRVSVSLMNSFYENVKKGKQVDDALTYAKRDYIKNADEFSADPRIWASLVVYGDDRIVSGSSGITIYLLLVLIMLEATLFAAERMARLNRTAV